MFNKAMLLTRIIRSLLLLSPPPSPRSKIKVIIASVAASLHRHTATSPHRRVWVLGSGLLRPAAICFAAGAAGHRPSGVNMDFQSASAGHPHPPADRPRGHFFCCFSVLSVYLGLSWVNPLVSFLTGDLLNPTSEGAKSQVSRP